MPHESASDYWSRLSRENVLASTIDPADTSGRKNAYIAMIRDRTVARLVPMAPPDGRALDFGCGHGDLDPVLLDRGYCVVGLDITASLLETARTRAQKSEPLYVRYDGATFPFRAASFDLIVSYGVLIYFDVESLQKKLQEMRSLLAAGGVALFIEQCRRRSLAVPTEAKTQLTVAEWKTLLGLAGYTVDACIVCRHGHMPLLHAIRWGLWPRRWWARTMDFEQWLGRKVGILPGDYADVAYLCSLRKD